MLIIDLTYQTDTLSLLSHLELEQGLIWYHDGLEHSKQEWFAAWPSEVYEYLGNNLTVLTKHSQVARRIEGDFFELLKEREIPVTAVKDVRFSGGYAGHLSYDLGLELHKIESRHPPIQTPLAVVGRYDWCCHINHEKRYAKIIIQPHCPEAIRSKIQQFIDTHHLQSTYQNKSDIALTPGWQCQMDQPSYEAAFDSIQQYILNGDIYQANLTRQWLSEEVSTSDWQTYLKLIKHMPAPFSVFQRCTRHSLLSVSPERFIRIEDNVILTQPIKGTRPRGKDEESDREFISELSNSDKDRAENLMIVDLLRNDIARNAIAGSVRVDKLFEIQSFQNVHHLVSSISADLVNDRHPLDVLRDAFPGGSITGAPKKRAMEIIDELETGRRGNYCGASFVLSANGYFDSNILIRSMTYHQERLTCSGGGGIVHDSKCDEEYEESAVKVKKLLQALE